MSINICSPSGQFGGISLTPLSTSTTGNQPLNYSITISSFNSTSRDINADFRIEPGSANSIKTGNFIYSFNEYQRRIYSIRETENGFSFKFNNRNDKLDFTLTPSNFYSLYEAALIVDADLSGYGTSTVELIINPETRVVDIDNYEEYREEFGLDTAEPPPETEPSGLIDSPEFINNVSSLDVINEYNFYQENFEKTTLIESELININKQDSNEQILVYFDNPIISKFYYSNTLHTKDYMKEEYPILNERKNLFPMYMEIKFETDNSKAAFSSYLSKLGILEYFCFSYLQSPTPNRNIIQFINSLKNINSNISDINVTGIFNGRTNDILNFKNNSIQKKLILFLLDKQISVQPNLIKNQIIMYKLEKRKNDTPISAQYFTNNLEYNEIIAFDTQLKYDTEYEYRVYKIETLSDETITETLIDQYVAKSRIIDSPPLPPELTFIPFKGVDNQILINLNASVGRYADYPVIIKESDIPIFNKILQNKKYSRLLQNENRIQFESDEGAYRFEMYRLETPPESYSDFKNSYSLITDFTSVLDEIMPNKKYYYIFRSIDIHGNLSNPTKPIEIEIINENGTIFMISREYIFGEKEKILSKTFKNIIELKPSKEQIEINERLTYNSSIQSATAKSATEIQMFLGNKEISLWNKQFLMRITSKKTGKKIDLKFKFVVSRPNQINLTTSVRTIIGSMTI